MTEYQAQTALLVVSLLDPQGNTGASLRDSFIAAATAGLCPAPALRDGLELLVRLGFVNVDHDFYRRTPALVLLQQTEPPEAQVVLRQAAAAQEIESEALREAVGRAAEEHVVKMCVDELHDLGRPDLADNVLQVSTISDRYGYDVSAPTIGAPARQLEVKGSTQVPAGLFRFFLTRHEYTVGRNAPSSWSLVACTVRSAGGAPGSNRVERPEADMTVELLGHCRADVLAAFVPHDANGRWTEALVSLPRHLLREGLPTPVP